MSHYKMEVRCKNTIDKAVVTIITWGIIMYLSNIQSAEITVQPIMANKK